MAVFSKAADFVRTSLNTNLTLSANIPALENAQRLAYGPPDAQAGPRLQAAPLAPACAAAARPHRALDSSDSD